MWNAWTAPPGALPRDYDPWSCEAHCARCGELAQDCHCEDDEEEPMSRRRKRRLRGVVGEEGVLYCIDCGTDVWTWSYEKDIREDIEHFQRCIPCIAKGQKSGALGPGLDGGTYEEGHP